MIELIIMVISRLYARPFLGVAWAKIAHSSFSYLLSLSPKLMYFLCVRLFSQVRVQSRAAACSTTEPSVSSRGWLRAGVGEGEEG